MSNNKIDNKSSSQKESNQQNKDNLDLPNVTAQENPNIPNQKKLLEKEAQDKKDNPISSVNLKKIPEQHEIKSIPNLEEKEKESNTKKDEEANQFENEKKFFINDYYSEESEKNSPKIIEGKTAIDINEIIGDETKQPITIEMIDDPNISLSAGKISAKSFGVIASYAANTNQGIVRE